MQCQQMSQRVDRQVQLGTLLALDAVIPSPLAALRRGPQSAAVQNGTRRAYRSAWSGYERWCRSLGREPLSGDAGTLTLYATACAGRGLSPASLRVHLAAIQAAHRLAGVALDPREPRLAMVLEGIARNHGTRPRRPRGRVRPTCKWLAKRLQSY